jgi:hypothetical protein
MESSVQSGQQESVVFQERRPTRIRAWQATSPASDAKGRAILHASDLLKRAAGLLDNNERFALRLIHQAIAILKHEVVAGMGNSDYDRVSLKSRRWPFEPLVEITEQRSGERRPHKHISRQWRDELDDGHTTRYP